MVDSPTFYLWGPALEEGVVLVLVEETYQKALMILSLMRLLKGVELGDLDQK